MLESDPLWYKDAIVYEVHVRAFHDSAGEGMGDFRGLAQKLDYLQDLGITAIWLLPFYPSPLRDDGYDIADYTNIHPHYGTLRDFKDFLDAAHQRGLRVITELVLNHTSDQHPWFQRARRAPAGSSERNFYCWSDTPDKYKDARIIFKDFEQSNWSWDPVARAYYWHRFYSHQPDLNYDNPAVWQAIFPVVDFWMNMGVDGVRLDAVPYLYEREGTNCENLPETHEFLKALRRHVDSKFPNRMLLAEANQWPEDAAAYFGAGDECHMAFHFPVMPRLFMAIHMENRFPILDIMAQTPAIAENCQWALFLRNHDELTLEMVTDEERDYMYRAYANDRQARINLGIRRRLAPLLGNNRRRIELMNGLLFSQMGTPIIYYGDEIGMGDNIYLGDRNGVRTPMQWSADRNAGFSRANPQKLYLPVIIDPEYHYETSNVEAQRNNPNSLLWWMKRLIALRKSYKAFGRGSLEFLKPDNRKILAFLRRYQDERILIVANLSRFSQSAALDLSSYEGMVPVELFGRTPFHAIGKQPYLLTLGPHSFFWFSLEPQKAPEFSSRGGDGDSRLPVLQVTSRWEDWLGNSTKGRLEEVLPTYLRQCRWFGSKARIIKSTVIREARALRYAPEREAQLSVVDVEYTEGPAETYLLPLVLNPDDGDGKSPPNLTGGVVGRLQGAAQGILADGLGDPVFCRAIVEAMRTGYTAQGTGGGLITSYATDDLPELPGAEAARLAPVGTEVEANSTSIVFGNEVVLKVFRKVEDGTNPDLELGRFLTERSAFPYTPRVLGAVEYRRKRTDEPMTLAILRAWVPPEGDAWQYTMDELSSFFERVLAGNDRSPQVPGAGLVDLAAGTIPGEVPPLIGSYWQAARLLGQRVGELHGALTANSDNPNFAPEPFTTHYQRSMYQSMRNQKALALELLGQRLRTLPEMARGDAQRLLELDDEMHRRLRSLLGRKIAAQRTRGHGDLHLGRVFYTGKDFVIPDFEGDTARSISERRLKRSPLRDVASMVRSFSYSAYGALLSKNPARGQTPGVIRPEDVAVLEPWTRWWYTWVSAAFLQAYLEHAAAGTFLPQSRDELKILFEVLMLEKGLQELLHELIHRPDMLSIPIKGLLQMLQTST
jgi:maltose alpha-D-glucosyltransferase/alpha-amylase